MTTKLAFAAAFLLALVQSGCASCPSGDCASGHCATPSCGSPILPQPVSRHYSHKYKPRYAHKTLNPSPCNIKTPYYGFHSTCWSAWPLGWRNCELPCGSVGLAGAPGELEYAEPVEPLESGEDDLDPMDDQGDGETSPSDTGDEESLPPPAEGDEGEMPADEAPAEGDEADGEATDDMPPALPKEPAPPIPAAPAAEETDPFDLPKDANEGEDEAIDELDEDTEGDAAPEATPPPTSSRPRPLRAAEQRAMPAPRVATSKPTATIHVLEEASMPMPLEEVVIEEAAIAVSERSEPKSGEAAVEMTFDDASDAEQALDEASEPSEFAAPALRIGDRPERSPSVSRPTITIVEVSAQTSVELADRSVTATLTDAEAAPPKADESFDAGAITVPAPKAGKTSAKPKSEKARSTSPVRRRLSDDADEEVRPVNWIDSFLKSSGR